MKLSVYILLLVFATLWSGCEDTSRGKNPAKEIIGKAIAHHGSDAFLSTMIDFDFRGQHYTVQRDGNSYIYWRTQKDSSGRRIDDLMGNDFFFRCIDDVGVPLTAEYRAKYRNSLNSVVYFALLPFRLQDPAVNARYLGVNEIKGQSYYQIEVTFDKEGGGKDFEDRFVFWFHREKHSMDYLAYRYHTEGGGVRFREAFNSRRVGGLRFADYRNYKTDPGIDIATMGHLFETNSLQLLSTVALENVQVNPIRK